MKTYDGIEPHSERECPCAEYGGCADEGGCVGCCAPCLVCKAVVGEMCRSVEVHETRYVAGENA